MRTFLLLWTSLLTACGHSTSAGTSAEDATASFDGAEYRTPAQKIAHGQRLAVVLDCTGCHGSNLQGRNATVEDPGYGKMYAPNVTLIAQWYSDADFERLIRDGVPKDGREFWFMPVESFQFLSGADLAAIIAYIRSLKPTGAQLPPIEKGRGFYEDVDRGFSHARQQVARYREEALPDMGPRYDRGRKLVRILCTACHNGKLQGYAGFTPDLDIAGAYSKEELTRLLSTGEGKTKKNLGMMSEMGRDQFSQLTTGEREAIVNYVLARANRPQ